MRRWIVLLMILCVFAASARAEGASWTCPNYNAAASGSFCSNCGAARPSGSGKPEPAENTTGPVIQDPIAFFKTLNYSTGPKAVNSKGTMVFAFVVPLEQIDALKEYSQCVMDHYSFRYLYSDEPASWQSSTLSCDYLTYTGSESMASIWSDHDVNLRFSYTENQNDGTAALWVYYAEQIGFVDDDFRCSFENVMDLGQNANNHPDDPDPIPSPTFGIKPKEKKDCPYCIGGYNDCKTCDGDGYIDVWVDPPAYSGMDDDTIGHYERKRCSNFKCLNGRVECSHCNGIGYTYE